MCHIFMVGCAKVADMIRMNKFFVQKEHIKNTSKLRNVFNLKSLSRLLEAR